MTTVERFFSLDHPTAQGHFPGNPIIPGAVLLSETLRAIEASLNISLSPGRLVSAKFLNPTRPGDSIGITFSDSASGAISFVCSVGQVTVLTGTVKCEAIFTPV